MMKEATIAPLYACLYAGLCDIARGLGYCLAIHGTISRDLDLIAIPWTAEAVSEEELVLAIKQHANACSYRDLLLRTGTLAEHVDKVIEQNEKHNPCERPHGRRTFALHMEHGCYIDLSVMPRSPSTT